MEERLDHSVRLAAIDDLGAPLIGVGAYAALYFGNHTAGDNPRRHQPVCVGPCQRTERAVARPVRNTEHIGEEDHSVRIERDGNLRGRSIRVDVEEPAATIHGHGCYGDSVTPIQEQSNRVGIDGGNVADEPNGLITTLGDQ